MIQRCSKRGMWKATSKIHSTGFDYGLPLVNYLITGWVPNRIFPQKYFIIDFLASITNKNYPVYIDTMLFGGKSTLFGSFYSHGWLIGVVLGAILIGFLSRKMDGMLRENSPQLIKAVGISWMSVLWMVWGSADYWGINVLGAITIPAIVLWLFSPKYKPSKIVTQVISTNRNYTPKLVIYPNQAMPDYEQHPATWVIHWPTFGPYHMARLSGAVKALAGQA